MIIILEGREGKKIHALTVHLPLFTLKLETKDVSSVVYTSQLGSGVKTAYTGAEVLNRTKLARLSANKAGGRLHL